MNLDTYLKVKESVNLYKTARKVTLFHKRESLTIEWNFLWVYQGFQGNCLANSIFSQDHYTCKYYCTNTICVKLQENQVYFIS